MIYTSYFAKMKTFPQNLIPIAICRQTPDWYKGRRYWNLMPSFHCFRQWKQTHDDNQYIERYKQEVLAHLSPQLVKEHLERMSRGHDIVLLCYEKPTDFCHRHLVAEWFRQNGIPCREYGT